MITCCVRYVIDPYKVDQFEAYARLWIPLVNRLGGEHHGYFLPREGANDVALALFSFVGLTAYEQYLALRDVDPECKEAFAFAERSRCIRSYEWSVMRPIYS